LMCTLIPSQAQQTQCLPASANKVSETSSPVYVSWNDTHVCVAWVCYLPEFTPQYQSAMQRVEMCGPWSDLHLIGSRLQTIKKAKDALASLQNARSRFPISDMGSVRAPAPQWTQMPRN
jgi:hypothetical protein